MNLFSSRFHLILNFTNQYGEISNIQFLKDINLSLTICLYTYIYMYITLIRLEHLVVLSYITHCAVKINNVNGYNFTTFNRQKLYLLKNNFEYFYLKMYINYY